MEYHVAKECSFTLLHAAGCGTESVTPTAPREGDPTRKFLNLSSGSKSKVPHRVIDNVSDFEIAFANTITKSNISALNADAILKTLRSSPLTANCVSEVSSYTTIMENIKAPGHFMEESLASATALVKNLLLLLLFCITVVKFCFSFQVHEISIPNPLFHLDGLRSVVKKVQIFYNDVVEQLVESVFDPDVLSRCTDGKPYTISATPRYDPLL
jgi:hypothetical protein